jgi:hypothetical protein
MKDRDCLRVQGIVDEMSADDMPLFVAKHISGCPDCRQYADKLNGLRKLLRSSHRVTVPDDFDVRLRLRLQNRSAQRRSFWAFVPTPALAAAAIFVVMFSITYTLVRNPVTNTPKKSDAAISSGTISQQSQPAKSSNESAPVIATVVNPAIVQEIDAPPSKRYVPTTRTVAAGQRSMVASDELPGETILLRDQKGVEQLMHVKKLTIGATPVMPRSSANRRIQYEPSIF